MPARKTHDAVATIGKYKDSEGNEKKRFLNVGSLFTDEEGGLPFKQDAFPASPEWSGWIKFYPVKDRQDSPRSKPAPPSRLPASTQDDDGIPF